MRTISIRKCMTGLLAAGLSFGLIAGCGGGGVSSGGSTGSFFGTQGPGDVWTWNLNGSTFTATNKTKSYTYSGTIAQLKTGFMKLTITSTTDPNVSVGNSAYAIELPGTALVLKPAGADTHPPIFAASLGTNPPGPIANFNYVKIAPQGWVGTDEAYGHVSFAVNGDSYTGTVKEFELNGTALPDGHAVFTGDNGQMTQTGGNGSSATGAMTPSGVCVLDYGPGQGGTIGVEQPAANVDLATIGGDSFKGFMIKQGKTECVSCTPNGDGTLHGNGYALGTGVETGTLDGGGGVTVSFTSQPNPGLVKVSIVTSGGNEQIVACLNQVGGKYMIFGFGWDGIGTPYNIVLVQS